MRGLETIIIQSHQLHTKFISGVESGKALLPALVLICAARRIMIGKKNTATIRQINAWQPRALKKTAKTIYYPTRGKSKRLGLAAFYNWLGCAGGRIHKTENSDKTPKIQGKIHRDNSLAPSQLPTRPLERICVKPRYALGANPSSNCAVVRFNFDNNRLDSLAWFAPQANPRLLI